MEGNQVAPPKMLYRLGLVWNKASLEQLLSRDWISRGIPGIPGMVRIFEAPDPQKLVRLLRCMAEIDGMDLDLGVLEILCNPICLHAATALRTILSSSTSLEHLELRDCSMTSNAWSRLAKGLENNSSILTLSLTDDLAEIKGAPVPESMMLAILQMPRLEYLTFSHEVTIGTIGAHLLCPNLRPSFAIGKALARNSSLVSLELNLTESPHNKYYIAELANGLKDNTVLKKLDLSENELDDDDIQAVAHALRHNSSLVALNLSGNMIMSGGEAALAQLLQLNSTLELLGLNSCGLRDTSALIGPSLGVNTTLKHLAISGHALCSKAIQALAHGLCTNATLETLFGWSSKPRKHTAQLCKALVTPPSLVHVELTCKSMGEEDMAHVTKALLLANTRLKSLQICCKRITEQAARLLWDALAHNTSLLRLSCEDVDLSRATPSFLTFLKVNTTLTTLRMECVNAHVATGDATVPNLVRALRHCQNLRSFHMEVRQADVDFRDTDGALLALAEALRMNPMLTHVALFTSYFEPNRPQPSQAAVLAVCEALRQVPRLQPLTLDGVPFNLYVSACGIPTQNNEAKSLCCRQVAKHLLEMHVPKWLAFAMGQHARLGHASRVLGLSADLYRMVMLTYFNVQEHHINMCQTAALTARDVPTFMSVFHSFLK
jgi:Ran GTPase-activating protein (RanGAP) involved in mRNA processing and transport